MFLVRLCVHRIFCLAFVERHIKGDTGQSKPIGVGVETKVTSKWWKNTERLHDVWEFCMKTTVYRSHTACGCVLAVAYEFSGSEGWAVKIKWHFPWTLEGAKCQQWWCWICKCVLEFVLGGKYQSKNFNLKKIKNKHLKIIIILFHNCTPECCLNRFFFYLCFFCNVTFLIVK